MADRTGEHSEWVERTRQALKSIAERIADEDATLAKLPYTRADFEAYLAQMEAAANGPAGMPSGSAGKAASKAQGPTKVTPSPKAHP
jgi:hypothetical protein